MLPTLYGDVVSEDLDPHPPGGPRTEAVTTRRAARSSLHRDLWAAIRRGDLAPGRARALAAPFAAHALPSRPVSSDVDTARRLVMLATSLLAPHLAQQTSSILGGMGVQATADAPTLDVRDGALTTEGLLAVVARIKRVREAVVAARLDPDRRGHAEAALNELEWSLYTLHRAGLYVAAARADAARGEPSVYALSAVEAVGGVLGNTPTLGVGVGLAEALAVAFRVASKSGPAPAEGRRRRA